MRRVALFVLALGVTVSAQAGPLDAVYGVVRRTIGEKYVGKIGVSLAPAPRGDGKDWYDVEAHGGRLTIQASSPTAATRGFYDYLKQACHCQVNWSESNLTLPATLPDFKESRIVSPAHFRHYYNICTFGYTTAFWDWKRWEKEIDWMALHGINMPLSLNGQDYVWLKTFRSFGLPDESILKFFSGPAFRPWHWMGNLNGHGGPPSMDWLEGQAALEKKILARELELGMTPVASGFSGFVPVDFAKFHQGVKLFSPTSWAGFDPTTFVDVRDPLFVEIGKKYIEKYHEEFGDGVHYWLCDTFNEQNPQFPDATKLADLKACGQAVYKAIHEGDPDGVWVMQGWLFYNAQDYWHRPEVEALLSGVPEGKMIILDLATYQYPVYQRQPAVAQKGWILNTLHNYGQNTALGGDLQGFADTVATALTSPDKGRMLGMGLTPEGVDQNAVVYELMTDLMWTDKPCNVPEWLVAFESSRYGAGVAPGPASKAWQVLYDGAYSPKATWGNSAWRDRPNMGRASDPGQRVVAARLAASSLDEAGTRLRDNRLYTRDLVDVAKTWLGMQADTFLAATLMSWQDNKASYQKYKAKFLGCLDDVDAVMACMPEHRLSTWIAMARSWGKTPAEKDLMERNARMQITTWDTKDVLTDYANKEWAGLTEEFLKGRWEFFFSKLEASGPPSSVDQLKWELAWVNSTKPPRESKPQDPVKLVARLLDKYPVQGSRLSDMLDVPREDPGIAVGKPVTSSPGQEAGSSADVVTDGDTMGAWWSASPPPQWVQIDLETIKKVHEIDLFCYWRDQRYYQYQIDVSTDGLEWRTVVDASNNTALSTYRGYRHKFEPVAARYVRVTMLKNSANIGQHIHEVRVYGN